MTKRLKVFPPKVPGKLEDYDLSKENFLVYVPEGYDPGKPMGLVVLANYKHSDTMPEAVLPQFAEANCALIVPNEYLEVWWQRAGLDLDAAYNMEKQYNIDPKRVYVFGGGDWPDKADGKSYPVGERLGLFYPEVFTGTFTVGMGIYRRYPEQTPQGVRTWPPMLQTPEAGQLTLAKQHPFVVGLEGEEEWQTVALKVLKMDGFKLVKTVSMTLGGQYHYPNWTTDWVPGVLKELDAGTANLKVGAKVGAGTRP